MQTPYADDAGILLQMKGKLTIGKVKSLRVFLILRRFIPYYSTLIIFQIAIIFSCMIFQFEPIVPNLENIFVVFFVL
jgi:hypothetical protein